VKDICEVIMFVAACAVPVSVMGFAAFLIYKQVNGWGWYLIFAALVCSGMKFKVGS
jgi:hypothetical protein